MASTLNSTLVPGIWGPYFSSMFTGLWLLEGGQSSSGSLLDFLTQTHPAYSLLESESQREGISVFQYLNNHLMNLKEKKNLKEVDYLTRDFHILPDFHGNRSPIADPTISGMMNGLTLDRSLDDLALKYLAGVQALAYGAKHIISSFHDKGVEIKCLIACGGLARNQLFIDQHAQILQIPICIPSVISESVPLGAAITASLASGHFSSLYEAGSQMSSISSVIIPNPRVSEYHLKKYAVFLKMYSDQKQYKQMMEI
jgi:FGGY-family pentulose kinase